MAVTASAVPTAEVVAEAEFVGQAEFDVAAGLAARNNLAGPGSSCQLGPCMD